MNTKLWSKRLEYLRKQYIHIPPSRAEMYDLPKYCGSRDIPTEAFKKKLSGEAERNDVIMVLYSEVMNLRQKLESLDVLKNYDIEANKLRKAFEIHGKIEATEIK